MVGVPVCNYLNQCLCLPTGGSGFGADAAHSLLEGECSIVSSPNPLDEPQGGFVLSPPPTPSLTSQTVYGWWVCDNVLPCVYV